MAYDAESIRYPRVSRRIEAVLIDASILLALFFGAMNLFAPMQIHGAIKAFVIFSTLLLLEPMFLTLTGASIGHHIRGMRVISARSGANLHLLAAILRTLVKAYLGFISLIFVLTSRRHQAIHDMAARSLVILKDPANVAAGASLPERRIEEEGYIYPSKSRRVVFILLYSLAVLATTIALTFAFTSQECIFQDRCSNTDNQLELLFSVVFWFFAAMFIVAGWKGRLWGARRKPAGS